MLKPNGKDWQSLRTGFKFNDGYLQETHLVEISVVDLMVFSGLFSTISSPDDWQAEQVRESDSSIFSFAILKYLTVTNIFEPFNHKIILLSYLATE